MIHMLQKTDLLFLSTPLKENKFVPWLQLFFELFSYINNVNQY